ncbi:thymocyte nuclear protein [Spatholobus suberectus]|nr:thymocyte nuclear protein [Spatholobus suberectus]
MAELEWVDKAVNVKVIGEMRRLVDLKEMKHFKDFALEVAEAFCCPHSLPHLEPNL